MSFTDLMGAAWIGDNKTEQFRVDWGNVLRGCGTKIEEKTRKVLLLKQLRKAQALKQDVVYSDRLNEGRGDEAREFPSETLRRHIELKRLQSNRDATAGAHGRGSD